MITKHLTEHELKEVVGGGGDPHPPVNTCAKLVERIPPAVIARLGDNPKNHGLFLCDL